MNLSQAIDLVFIIAMFAALYYILFNDSIDKDIKDGLTPICMRMAIHHENAKLRVSYRNLDVTQELYKIGLRDGQFGIIVKHRSGMYAKTTVKGKCRFVPIKSYNYISTEG